MIKLHGAAIYGPSHKHPRQVTNLFITVFDRIILFIHFNENTEGECVFMVIYITTSSAYTKLPLCAHKHAGYFRIPSILASSH